MDIYKEIEETYFLSKSLHDSLFHRQYTEEQDASHNSVLSYIIEDKIEKIYREMFKNFL